MSTRTLFLGVLFSLLLQSCASAKTPQNPEDESSANCLLQLGFRQVDLVRTRDHLDMPVKINGRRATMIIGTNGPFSQLDRKLLPKLHLKEEETGVPVYGALGGSQQYGMATLKTLEVSNAVFYGLPVAIINLNVRYGVPRYDGIFALSELRAIGSVIDCDHLILYFNPKGPDRKASARLRVQLTREGFARVPLRIKSDVYLDVGCAINGHRSRMLVSTESFVTILTPETAAEAAVHSSLTKAPALALGGRQALMRHARVKDLSIGDFRIPNADLCVIKSDFNSLGIDQLEANRAIIDVGALALYLKRQSDK